MLIDKKIFIKSKYKGLYLLTELVVKIVNK
jgi:hypothetical protein